MFTQLKNIDTAVKHLKFFTSVVVVACMVITCVSIYMSYDRVKQSGEKIYILANGKAIEAFSTTRKDNLGVELRDHIKNFHQFFFTLDPDDKVIRSNLTRSFNLADETARKASDNLKEQGYYNNIIAANISQEIEIDSIKLDITGYPFQFRCFATQRLIRATISTKRNLVTQGWVRNVSRSESNPHGFLIQQWEIITNSDVKQNPYEKD